METSLQASAAISQDPTLIRTFVGHKDTILATTFNPNM